MQSTGIFILTITNMRQVHIQSFQPALRTTLREYSFGVCRSIICCCNCGTSQIITGLPFDTFFRVLPATVNRPSSLPICVLPIPARNIEEGGNSSGEVVLDRLSPMEPLRETGPRALSERPCLNFGCVAGPAILTFPLLTVHLMSQSSPLFAFP
jgi:hypothetical protein